MDKVVLLILLALTPLAHGQNLPYAIQKTDDGKIDATAVQENFEYLSNKIKQLKITTNGLLVGFVTSVTGTSPICSTGGENPVISFCGTIPESSVVGLLTDLLGKVSKTGDTMTGTLSGTNLVESGTITHGTGVISSGGNTRGANATDMQTYRTAADEVASGAGATIGGGGKNVEASSWATIGGGSSNTITAGADYSVIDGGLGNSIQDGSGSIGGGTLNRIDPAAGNSTIGGGRLNWIQYDATHTEGWGLAGAFIGGGQSNYAGSAGTIGGGYSNYANSYGSIGGGYDNYVHYHATVGGGKTNTANAIFTTIGGGLNNTITSATYGTVPGGRDNGCSSGSNYCFAAGYGSNANALGAWALSDGTGSGVTNTTANSLKAAFSGGYYWTGGASTFTAIVSEGNVTAPAFIGALTGAASLNVLKSGDTMTGQLTNTSSITVVGALGVKNQLDLDGSPGVIGYVAISSGPGLPPTWQPFPTSGQSVFYFQSSATDVSGVKLMASTQQVAQSTITLAGATDGVQISTWITSVNVPFATLIPSGIYTVRLHAAQTSGTKNAHVYAQIWETDSSGSYISQIGDTSAHTANLSAVDVEYTVSGSILSNYSLSGTGSRIVVKIFVMVLGVGSAPTVEIYYAGHADGHLALPANSTVITTLVPYDGALQNVNLGIRDLTASGGVFGSTLTVYGNAMSVGGSSFTVNGGSATVAYSMTAGSFIGNGSLLSGIPSSGSIVGVYVPVAGGTMTGQLTNTSTVTVHGNAFSVGGSSFVVAGGSATVAYSMTAGAFLGNATTASAFFTDPINCSAGNYPLGIDASGNVESCTSVSAGTELNTYGTDGSSKTFVNAVKISSGGLVVSLGNISLGGTGMVSASSAVFTYGVTAATMTAGAFSGTVIGSSTLNVLKVGDTMTGLLRVSSDTVVTGQSDLGDVGGVSIRNVGAGTGTIGFNSRGNGIGTYVSGVDGYGALMQLTPTTGLMTYYSESNALAGGNHSHITAWSVDNAGNFGIKNAAPATVLDVTGAAQFGIGAKSTFTASGNLAVGYGMVASTGIFKSTLTVQGDAFSVDGSALVVSGGKIGLGIASPAARLHVDGGGTSVVSTFTRTSGTSASMLVYSDNSGAGITDSSAFNKGIYLNRTSNAIEMFMGGSAKVAVSSLSYVGIGTLAPIEPLHVNGASFSGGNANSFSGAGVYTDWVSPRGRITAGSGGGNNRNLVLRAQNLGVVNENQVFLQFDGKVGISIDVVRTTLDVNGDISAGVGGTRSTFTSTGNLQLVSGSTLTSNGTFSLSTGSVSSQVVTPSIFVNKDGEVGILSRSPSEALTVGGAALAGGAAANDYLGTGVYMDFLSPSARITAGSAGGNNRNLLLRAVTSGGVPYNNHMFLGFDGSVGLSTNVAQTKLDVNGDASFGAAGAKSTFTVAGLLKLTAGGIQWADGSTSTTSATAPSGFVTVGASNTFTGENKFTKVAPTGVTITTVNVLYASGLNQAFAVFVASNASAVLQYSVGVTSVTYSGEGRYIVNWQSPFAHTMYHRSITAGHTSGTSVSCMVNEDTPLSRNMTSIMCNNQSGGSQNPFKVYIMATGAQ